MPDAIMETEEEEEEEELHPPTKGCIIVHRTSIEG